MPRSGAALSPDRAPALRVAGALAIAAALVAAPGTARSAGASPAEDWRIEDGREIYPRAGLSHLELTHLLGDVRVEGTDADVVVVTYVAQRHRDDPRRPMIVASIEDGTQRILPGFAALEVEEEERWQRRRMDVAVAVPRDLPVTISAGAGLLEVAELDAPARLRTVSGEIVYDGVGGLEATSESGRVRALLRSTDTGTPVRVETVTGDVWIQFLEGASAVLALATRGPITTDFSIAVERERGRRLKRATATLGSGRRPVNITSHGGGIRLIGLIVEESN